MKPTNDSSTNNKEKITMKFKKYLPWIAFALASACSPKMSRSHLTETPLDCGSFESIPTRRLTIEALHDRYARNLATCSEAWTHITMLIEIDLTGAGISDLDPLSAMTQLKTLKLGTNKISDFSGIARLAGLTTLELGNNQITDIRPLDVMENLTTLDLSGNKIVDIRLLAHLRQLTDLNLAGNKIGDVSPLAGLTQLTSLSLTSNNIADFSALSGLVNLTTLTLEDNKITDISPLSGLTKLQSLFLRGNQITSIPRLDSLISLTSLDLQYNKITDISRLDRLTTLKSLVLNNNQITDLSPLGPLTLLEFLGLSSNRISYVGALRNLNHLAGLTLKENPIASSVQDRVENFRPLRSLLDLQHFDFGLNILTDETTYEASYPILADYTDADEVIHTRKFMCDSGLVFRNIVQDDLTDSNVKYYCPTVIGPSPYLLRNCDVTVKSQFIELKINYTYHLTCNSVDKGEHTLEQIRSGAALN